MINLNLINWVGFLVIGGAFGADDVLVPSWLDKVRVVCVLLANVVLNAFHVESLPALSSFDPSSISRPHFGQPVINLNHLSVGEGLIQ